MEKPSRTIITRYLPFIAIFFFGVFVTLPLFQPRFIPTHDGEYSILRFWQFFLMLTKGDIFPVIAPTINNGFGLPVFLFFYPFSNYIGAFFHAIGFSFVDAVKMTLAFSYVSALLGCYYWLSAIFSKRLAFFSTLVGACVPYWFVEMYVRGSVPEMVAFGCVFFLLAFIERRNVIGVTLFATLLLLSHNIMALLYFPVLFLYVILRRRTMTVFFLLSLGIAAYFLIPAFFEQQFVTGLNTVSFKDHFAELYELLIPSWGTGFSGVQSIEGKMSFQIGIVPLSIIIFSGFLSCFTKQREYRKFVWSVLVILLIGLFMTTRITTIIWDRIPLLPFIQHPWRFLAFLFPSIPFLSSYMFFVLRPKSVLIFVFVVLAFLFSWSYMRPVTYEKRNDIQYIENPTFRDGTISLGNSFSTIWMTWKEIKENVSKIMVENGQTTTPISEKNYTEKAVSVQSNGTSKVVFPIAYYPGWQSTIDGKKIVLHPSEEGLIAITVPEGTHVVRLWFGMTMDRFVGIAVSLMSLTGAIFLIIRYNRASGRFL